MAENIREYILFVYCDMVNDHTALVSRYLQRSTVLSIPDKSTYRIRSYIVHTKNRLRYRT